MQDSAIDLVGIALDERQWTTSLIEAIYDGILIADKNAIVCYVNPGYLKITGLAENDIIGRSLADVRPSSVLPQVIRTGEPRLGVYRREGSSEYVVDMSPIRYRGEIVGGLSTVK